MGPVLGEHFFFHAILAWGVVGSQRFHLMMGLIPAVDSLWIKLLRCYHDARRQNTILAVLRDWGLLLHMTLVIFCSHLWSRLLKGFWTVDIRVMNTPNPAAQDPQKSYHLSESIYYPYWHQAQHGHHSLYVFNIKKRIFPRLSSLMHEMNTMPLGPCLTELRGLRGQWQ